ncbi:MAG: hypothetical protein MUF87_19295 [Anaerolineae bacterium]|jgi:hypothetical protein|nr:hypothetical protein [Anaerolineae bacterium]
MSATSLYNQALGYRRSNPQQARSLFEQARAVAEEEENYCFMLECDYWIWECTLWYLNDDQGAMDLAMRSLIEARKPQYARCTAPLADIHYTIASTYINYDPVGYETEALEILAYVESEMHPEYELWCLLSANRAKLALYLEAWDEAIHQSQIGLVRSQKSDFLLSNLHLKLCDLYALRQDWEQVAQHMEQAAENLQKVRVTVGRMSDVLLWRAVLAHLNGDSVKAQTWYRVHFTHLPHQDDYRDSDYIDLRCRYHTLLADWDQVWKLREIELTMATRGGSPLKITNTYRKRIAFLRQRGLPYESEYQAAIAAADKLRKPEIYLARLQNDLQCNEA